MEQLNVSVSDKKIIMQDIYHKINFKLVDNNFDCLSLEDKKDLVAQELKEYMILKILELDSSVVISKDVDIYILVDILGCLIPKENHFQTLRHLTHYVLQISSTMQGWEIVWFVEDDDKLIEQPLASFNYLGKWDKITTHENTDLVKCFKFTYDIFQNNFLNKNLVKQPILD